MRYREQRRFVVCCFGVLWQLFFGRAVWRDVWRDLAGSIWREISRVSRDHKFKLGDEAQGDLVRLDEAQGDLLQATSRSR